MKSVNLNKTHIMVALLAITVPFIVIILSAYYIADVISLKYTLYTIVSIFGLAYVYFSYTYIIEIGKLIEYVNSLAEGKSKEAPNVSFLSVTGRLSDALNKLHHSWEKQNVQLEISLLEREILLDILPDILLLIDKNGKIIKTNIIARDEFGDTIGEKQIGEIISDEIFLQSVNEIIKGNTNINIENIEFFIENNKKYFRAQFRNYPNYSKGEIIAVVALHDITNRKQIEKMQSDFVANVSHEMRTPLASFIGFIETLQNMEIDEKEARDNFLKIMERQANRMSNLVNDLLSLSKIESAEKIDKKETNIFDIVESTVQNVEFRAKGKDMNINLNAEDNIKSIFIDASKISHLIENLLTNSIKYANKGTDININITSDDNKICISVEDFGLGISKEHIPRLTERFYRVEVARSGKIEGTGLGLSIVRHILNLHNGELEVESEIGKGSKFSIYLPFKQ